MEIALTENLIFWIFIYISEGLIFGLVLFSNYLKNKKGTEEKDDPQYRKKIALRLLISYIGLEIFYMIGTIIIFNDEPQFMFFWLTIHLAIVILVINTYVSAILTGKHDKKINDILEAIQRIENKLDDPNKK